MSYHLSPNSLIENRYILSEKIAAASTNGEQIWAALDKQTNTRVIGRFKKNGNVEWFPDTRPIAKVSPKSTTTKPSTTPLATSNTPKLANKPTIVTPSINSSLNKDNKQKKSKTLLFAGLGLVLLILIVILFSMSDRLFTKTTKNSELTPEKVTENNDIKNPTAQPDKLDQPAEEINLVQYINTLPEDTRKTLIKLKILNQFPIDEHHTIFENAKTTFSILKKSGINPLLADSLSKAYKTNGETTYTDFKDTGNVSSKNNALEWYSLSYILDPDPEIEAIINYLKKRSVQKSANKIKKSPNKNPGFIKTE